MKRRGFLRSLVAAAVLGPVVARETAKVSLGHCVGFDPAFGVDKSVAIIRVNPAWITAEYEDRVLFNPKVMSMLKPETHRGEVSVVRIKQGEKIPDEIVGNRKIFPDDMPHRFNYEHGKWRRVYPYQLVDEHGNELPPYTEEQLRLG